jgi:succinate dehydrogenase/fumarate reductase flavoprotein subunit
VTLASYPQKPDPFLDYGLAVRCLERQLSEAISAQAAHRHEIGKRRRGHERKADFSTMKDEHWRRYGILFQQSGDHLITESDLG